MMSLWDALRMNMMISYQELVRTFLSCKPVSFDSANACDHFKIILILPIGIETFYSRCAAKTDLVTPILLGQIESPIGHRLQRFKLILPPLFAGAHP